MLGDVFPIRVICFRPKLQVIQRTEKLNAKTSVLYFIIEDTRQRAVVLTAAAENSVVAFSKKPARRRCEVGEKKKEKRNKERRGDKETEAERRLTCPPLADLFVLFKSTS